MTKHDGQKMIVVGSLGTAHGVNGWMKITSFTNPDTNILNYNPWYFKTQGRYSPITVIDKRIQGPYLIAKLTGCDDREIAKTWTGREISVPRSALPPCGDNEFYWTDLEGLSVFDIQGKLLGKLDTLMATGSNDVMLVSGEETLQIPFIMQDIVKNVNLEQGTITVDWQQDE
jgi:16S rRNA processing protein RimM